LQFASLNSFFPKAKTFIRANKKPARLIKEKEKEKEKVIKEEEKVIKEEEKKDKDNILTDNISFNLGNNKNSKK
jgi:hypothetical protein